MREKTGNKIRATKKNAFDAVPHELVELNALLRHLSERIEKHAAAAENVDTAYSCGYMAAVCERAQSCCLAAVAKAMENKKPEV